MRSILSRILSALRSGSTVNGSIGTCKKRDRFFMRCNSTPKPARSIGRSTRCGRTPRDVLEEHEIRRRRKVQTVEVRLREREVDLVPQTDVRHQLGKALLNFPVALTARGLVGCARRLIEQPINFGIA